MMGRGLAVVLLLTFAAGTLFGYQLKIWRIEYLKQKRGRLSQKLHDVQQLIDSEIRNAF